MAISPPQDPLIMIIGATGTGKSKLAVDLATRFNGEIINCDAMQMYKGLPIITNKITEEERKGIPHHLLDFIDLKEKPWSVQHFVKQSSRVINEIRARGKLPIVVGGTIYYTFSLLFNDAILCPSEAEDQEAQSGRETNANDQDFPIVSASTEEIFAKLSEVDPEMAKRWHPNDRQRIRTSLQIFLRSGRKASEIYAEQRRAWQEAETSVMANGSSSTLHLGTTERSMSLRFPSLLLWLEAEDAVLKQRLNDRVDVMIARGLCDEVVQMASLEEGLRTEGEVVDSSSGIWGSIGYKEMKRWLEAQEVPQGPAANIVALQQEGIEAIKASTRRYAKRQNRFVRIRLANALKTAGRPDLLFLLDCTDLDRWSSAVSEPAETLVKAFLRGDELPEAKTLSTMAETTLSQIEEDAAVVDREARNCELCNKTLMTEKEWNRHLASRGHKKLVASQRRRIPQPNNESRRIQLPTPPG
ncbi:tRNA dimethylallyltransferase, mitochondrial [Cladophialophora chaetospira]|uniref:tRNA dimethylallyltransferase n=1 Tax=Cladophialophora chaetospira TaxID=386627 RepID=A0AA39CCP1_9EURO|nr:tRNA dimethylallyltransferase, mitochondrial [Cladophialophora chaetospira]